MSRRMHATAAAGTALALGLAGSASASTADTTPTVVNREVVQAELDSAGKLDVARLFSQLSVVGKGTVAIADPTSSKGLRNLNGFGNPSIRDGKALYTIHVDGSTSRRTVSDYTKALPVTVKAAYTLGGKGVRAKDIVGKSGDVTATYTVANVSGVATPVSWKDGKGATHTEDVDLVTPLVGQISTTLPGSFTDLATPAADVAADGRGGTILTYSMVLFGPIGQETQTFTWSGHVRNGEVPAVTVQVLPASPTQKPELNTGVVGYRDGAAQASELTVGAGQIDANLLKLQNGAGDLLAGLTKLAAGAAELRDGLTGQLAPGAGRLASGAEEAKAGTAKLSGGLGQLAAGADELSGGLDRAATGSSALAAGLDAADAGAADLAAGIAQILAAVRGLPTALQADPDYQQLLGALTSVQGAIAAQLVPGINGLRAGVSAAKAGLQQISAGVTTGGTAIGALLVQLGTDIATQVGPLSPSVAAGLGAEVTTLGGALTSQSGQLLTGLAAVMTGLGSTTDMTSATVQGGLNLVKLGLDNPSCVLSNPTDPSNPCGIKQVQSLVSAGIDQLVSTISDSIGDALDQASAGAADLADGTSLLADGGAALDDGLGLLADGGSQLADGASDAADGAGQLDDGLGKISSGARQLADGATAAATGSQQLAEGLDKAKGGDKKVVDGAGELRSKGTQVLVAGGNATAGEAGKKYATLVALSDKVADGAMPYGAPEGATGTAAYQLTLAAADTTSHDNRNRAVAAVLLLLAACAISWTFRRRVASR